MPRLVYRNPNDGTTTYITMSASDPNIPAGYILESGSDGTPDRAFKTLVAGINSGGFPTYTGDPTQTAAQPNWPNGILGGGIGGTTQG